MQVAKFKVMPLYRYEVVQFDKDTKIKLKNGRNKPCPCGSDQKYKKCCIDKRLHEYYDGHVFAHLDKPCPCGSNRFLKNCCTDKILQKIDVKTEEEADDLVRNDSDIR